MSIESIVQSLDAAEARKQAVERRRSAELGELFAAVDERERRKSGLSPEEWADLKRERASAREALPAARQQAKEQRGGGHLECLVRGIEGRARSTPGHPNPAQILAAYFLFRPEHHTCTPTAHNEHTWANNLHPITS